MRTLADLEYDRPLGVDGEPSFRAQVLVQASTPLMKNQQWYAFRNDAWPDSDLDAPFLLGSITLQLELEDGYYAEVAFLAARGTDRLGAVKRRIRRMSVERWSEQGLGGCFLRSTVDAARENQNAVDASDRHQRAQTPWLFPGHTDADLDRAPWAREIAGAGEPFPAYAVDFGPSGTIPPNLTAIDDDRSWFLESLPDELRGSRQPEPVIPPHPVTVRATAYVSDMSMGKVIAQIQAGTRRFETTFEIGSRTDICGADSTTDAS